MPMIQKLVALDGKIVNASNWEVDFSLSRDFGKIRVGKSALFYRDGLKHICVPFEEMDRAFIRVIGGQSSMCCASMDYEYYRLVIEKEGKEIANVIVGEDLKPLEEALEYLKQVNPNVEIGYVKPEER